MDRTYIRNILNAAIADAADVNPSEITPGKLLKADLGMGSLEMIELVMEIEHHFKFEVTDEEAEGIETVGDVYDYVERRLAEDGRLLSAAVAV